jgi:arginase family enzyme
MTQMADTSVPQPAFFRAPFCADLAELDAQIALLGVPTMSEPPVPGARLAPTPSAGAGVYSAGGVSAPGLASGPFPGLCDIDAGRQRFTGVTIADCGNVAIETGDVEGNLERMTRAARAIVRRGSLMVAVGASTPPLRSASSTSTAGWVRPDCGGDHRSGSRSG